MFISHLFFLNWFLLLLLGRRRRGFLSNWWLRWNVLRGRWWCRVSGLFFVMGFYWFRFFLIIIFIRLSIRPVFFLFFLLLFLIEHWLFELSMLNNFGDHLWLHFGRFFFRRFYFGRFLHGFRDCLCGRFLVLILFFTRLILLCSLFLFWGRWLLLLLFGMRWIHIWLWYTFIIF